MRFLRNKKEDDPRLGIAPLIDIVFLLLIFFMVTSHFDLASGVKLQLPKMSTRIEESPRQETSVIIDKEGNSYLEGERITTRELKETLGTMVTEKGLIRIVLQADRDALHGKVMHIIDTARSAGVRSVIIAAGWSSGEAEQ